MKWDNIVKVIQPYIFKIETPDGFGTGFLCFYNQPKTMCVIATALHVVEYANTWRQPIKITHYSSANMSFLNYSDYIIFPDWKTDSAAIFFKKPSFELPKELIMLLPSQKILDIGLEVSWLGFPAIEPNFLCFFSGNISAWHDSRKAYLIDGVAINGVSGGPVMFNADNSTHSSPQIIGIISHYKANRMTGETLPGLLYAQDVSHFHSVIEALRSLEDAAKKKAEMEKLTKKE